jgi:putative oxidoreductase
MTVGRLAARAVIGGLFIGHGTQKLFGWFGGPGRAGTEAMMESLQMRPARWHALAAGVTETTGGALLATGFATPLAAASLTGVMTTAIRKVHLPNGPWAANGGWEYNVVLIAAVTALVETGPGDLSLDHVWGTERSGPAWALGALAVGVCAAATVMTIGARGTPSTTPASESSAVTAAHGDTAGDPTTTDS